MKMRGLHILLAALPLLGACKMDAADDLRSQEAAEAGAISLIVRGATSDLEAGLPVSGIHVTLSSYALVVLCGVAGTLGTALESAEIYSNSEGLFELETRYVGGRKYRLHAEDTREDATPSYAPAYLDISPISVDSPSYHPDSRTILLDEQILYLEEAD